MMNFNKKVGELTMSYENYKERVIEYRRYLHQHPELSFKEYETIKYIKGILEQMENCTIESITETSAVAIFNKGKGKKIGLRADIDALPVEEEADVDFKSLNKGAMHACGHDGHTATLLGALWYINDHIEEFDNEIVGIFQHAEELIPGGAREMVETGYFDDFSFIYGHHYWTLSNYGVIDVKYDHASANSDLYHIEIIGHGGHASTPQLNLDPIVAGTQFINNIQTIVSRHADPFNPVVVSNTVFNSGNVGSENVIPSKVFLGGSVRTLRQEDRQLVKELLEKNLEQLKSLGYDYTLKYTDGYDSVMNNEQVTDYVRSIVEEHFPGELVSERPMMGGEDFSAFSNRVPSCYAFIGAKAPGYDYNHHHPKFKLLEDVFEKGFKMFIEVARNGSKVQLN